jgi:RNA polymerase sigma-70 factor, ECF subfamily
MKPYVSSKNWSEEMDESKLDFHDIYASYLPKILRYVTHMVGELDAEDLTQEIFVKVSQSLSDFRGEAKLSTWLYRIATNAALDRLRSPTYKHAAQLREAEAQGGEVETEVDDRNIWTGEKVPVLEWQVVRKEMSECLQGYIQKLPESYRTVLALSEFEGLSNREVADILGVSLGTMKIRLHRAREKLKKDLIENCDSYWIEGNEFIPDLRRIK